MDRQSFKSQQELAEYLANRLHKMCRELDYIMKVVDDQIELLSPFEELHESYVLVHNNLKRSMAMLVGEVISNHIKYLEDQQKALGQAIKIQRGAGIPFLQQEMKKILKDMDHLNGEG